MRAHGGLALRWRNIDCAAAASLPGSGGRASKPARATPIETAAGFYRYTRSPGVGSIIRCESFMRSWRGPRLGSRAQNQGCSPGVDQGALGCSAGVLIPACQLGTLPLILPTSPAPCTCRWVWQILVNEFTRVTCQTSQRVVQTRRS